MSIADRIKELKKLVSGDASKDVVLNKLNELEEAAKQLPLPPRRVNPLGRASKVVPPGTV